MVNSKCIEVFLSIVEHKSISAVAKSTYLSQPTVSEYLNQLEQHVGTTLVLRGKGQRQIALTPAGEAFLPLARKWMDHRQELERQILDFRRAQSHNILRIAASSGAHQHVASHVICKLMASNPGIRVELCNVERREMPDAIEHFAFDVAFIFGDAPESDLIHTIPLFKEDQYILCPANTVLPDRVLTPKDLDPGHMVYYTAYRSAGKFKDWYEQCFPNTPLQPVFEASSLASIHNYLTNPNAWTVVPASIAMADISQRMGQLTCRKIVPEPPSRTCSLLIAKAYREEKLIRAFTACCEAFIAEQEHLHKI